MSVEDSDHDKNVGLPIIPAHNTVRRIGKGAYGEVWLGRNVLGTYRGVKIVRRSTFPDERPFQREFEGIERFEPISRSHPGFVQVLQVGRNEAAGWFYYVMEVADDAGGQCPIQPDTYVPRTLSEEINKRGRLPIGECIQIGIVLSGALAYLHRQGLIHRDIKPANIIYVGGTPRLADVGLVTDGRQQATAICTLGFAPEDAPGTVSADIFGLGKVLYEIATGESARRFPHLPTNLVEGADWLRFAPLNHIINAACAPLARDRYKTADEMHAALVALQEKGGTEPDDPSLPRPPGVHPVRQRKITLLHKVRSEPESRLVQLLQARLQAQGFEVFFDRRLLSGVTWARQIEAEIAGADAVVLLISAASCQCEMFGYEMELAHQAAQQQRGRPLRLPVRVQFTEPWPEPVKLFLDGLTSYSWDGPNDDDRLLDEIVQAMEATQKVVLPRPKFDPPDGAMPVDSRYYIERPTDELFKQAITRWDSIVRVKGARQMGKTSLLVRGLKQAKDAGARLAMSDFQKLSLKDLESADSFYQALGGLLADQLGLEVFPDAVWDKRRSANINFERYMRREVLGKNNSRLFWGLDEVDRLFGCSFGSEVFGLFRSWHNERAMDPEGPWSRLMLAMAYATEAHLFITDINQSPFNVGTCVYLEDFNLKQVMELNARYGAPLRDDVDLKRFYDLLGGQPYLVRRALNALALDKPPLSFEVLIAGADRDDGIFGDHLRRILVMLAKDPALVAVIRDLLQGRPCTDDVLFYRLHSAGVLRVALTPEAQFRCEMYASYLRRHLLR